MWAPSFMSYTIIGDPVNVAARLMQRAAPNEC
jgi:class 3 adenylate cyclase